MHAESHFCVSFMQKLKNSSSIHRNIGRLFDIQVICQIRKTRKNRATRMWITTQLTYYVAYVMVIIFVYWTFSFWVRKHAVHPQEDVNWTILDILCSICHTSHAYVLKLRFLSVKTCSTSSTRCQLSPSQTHGLPRTRLQNLCFA